MTRDFVNLGARASRRCGARPGRGHRSRRRVRPGEGHGRAARPTRIARRVGMIVNRFRGDPTLFDDGIAHARAARRRARAGGRALAAPRARRGGPAAPSADRRAAGSGRAQRRRDPAPASPTPRTSRRWSASPTSQSPGSPGLAPSRAATCSSCPGPRRPWPICSHHTASGTLEAVRQAWSEGTWVLGLCGGYQMMGARLEDPAGLDGPVGAWPGLAMFDATTRVRAGQDARAAPRDQPLARARPRARRLRDPSRADVGRGNDARGRGGRVARARRRARGRDVSARPASQRSVARGVSLARPSGSRAPRERTRGSSIRSRHASIAGPAMCGARCVPVRGRPSSPRSAPTAISTAPTRMPLHGRSGMSRSGTGCATPGRSDAVRRRPGTRKARQNWK